MTRPTSQAEYLAGLTPPSAAASGGVRRRALLKAAFGGAAALGASGLLTACGNGRGNAAPENVLRFGSNQSDEVPRDAYAAMVAAFADPALSVKTNTIDHNTFQENINYYLGGQPDDVFTWFAGFRMQFFAEQGLVGDVSDVWQNIGGMSSALKKASTGRDGRQYFVPLDYYPWAIYYRKSVFARYGYTAPRTLDELVALSTAMQRDGLVPFAFADKDGWPAMGTFDQLNLRINGYDYHVSLMAGEKSWNTPQVRTVFDTWKRLLPYHQTNALGRTWQEGAQALQQKKAGMQVFGMIIGQQFTEGPERDDLDFFPFPQIDPAIGTDAIEAPIDGFMMRFAPRNEVGAKKFLNYLAAPTAQAIYVKSDSSVVAASSDADTSGYTALQKKAADYVASAKSISQFMDRDTRPDFASTVMIPALQQFIADPQDIDGLLTTIDSQKKIIFER